MPQAMDPEWLGERLKAVRRERELTLQEVSDETKVSVPTLSRIERGEARSVSGDTLLALSKWAGVPVEVLSGTRREAEGATTPDIVELHLRADKNLDKRTAESLANLFRTVYEQVAEQMKNKKR